MENNLENTPGIETTHPIRISETGWKQLGEYTWNWNNSPNKKFRKRLKTSGEYTWNWNNSPNKKFRNRLKTTWRIHLELKQLTQQEVQKDVENNLENTPGIETNHPIRRSETGWKQLENTPGIETTHQIRSWETGWKQVGEYTWNWNNSPNKKFRNRVSCFNSRYILHLFSTSFWTSYWVSCFNSRCILQVVFNLFLKFLLGELFQFQVYSPSCFPPVSELLIGWVVSIPGVFSNLFSTCFSTSYLVSCFNSRCILQLFSTCFWTSYWVICFNSRCILQVVFHIFLNFLLGELFQFQVYSPSCFQPVSELLIGWVVSIPGVFSNLFSTCFSTSYLVSCFNSRCILQLFSTCFWTSYWVICFNSRCILQVVFHIFLNFLLGELFQFQVYSLSYFQPVSELLIGWVVSISGVFPKLFSTCFWTSYWVSCFNSRCIPQVVLHLFLNFLLGELFQFQVYSPSCFQPVSELLIGWKQLGEYTWNRNNSPNMKFRNRWKTTWRIHLELKQLTQ